MNRKNDKKVSMNDQIKIEMVGPDEMSEADRNAIFNREASIDAIPDLDVLTKNVFDILEYLERSDIVKLMRTNESAVKMYLNNKYADSVPLGIITMLMEEDAREENVEMMLQMFESLKQAKIGNLSLETAEKNLAEIVNNRYSYAKYGSKEAFERALTNAVKKEQSKKGKQNIESLSSVGKIKFSN